MFSSTVIPTIGRPSLSRAVKSVLDQQFTNADFEIIVVNDSGKPLAKAKWQDSDRVRVIQTYRHERSVARNVGAAVATGRYLHFLDDDDWLLPRALERFWNLACNSQAGWLYGNSELVDRNGNRLIELCHGLNGNCFVQAMAGEWIPLQASLIDANTFFSVGGFDPMLTGPEDTDLCCRIARISDLCGMEEVVAAIEMGVEGSTTDYSRSLILSRWAREKILEEPQAFNRLRKSANSAYWRGRIVRLYLTSLIWNLQNRRPMRSSSRVAMSIISLMFAGGYILHNDFWKAVRFAYDSPTFLRGFRDANIPVERRKLDTQAAQRVVPHPKDALRK